MLSLGAFQIFLRAGQMALLDKIRTEMMASSAIVLQRHARGFVARRRYLRTRRAIITLQVQLHTCILTALLPGNLQVILCSGSTARFEHCIFA